MAHFDPLDIAESLAAHAVDRLEFMPARNGTEVWKVVAGTNVYRLKRFATADGDERLLSETEALKWLAERGLAHIPHLVAIGRKQRTILTDWPEGEIPLDPTAKDVEGCLAFLVHLRGLRKEAESLGGLWQGPHPERMALLKETDTRLKKLDEIAERQSPVQELLSGSIAEARSNLPAAATRGDLPVREYALCGAEFSLPLCLRRADGRITVSEFEYFGWRDPAKVVADFVLDPEIALPPRLAVKFRDALIDLYDEDWALTQRLEGMLSLYALRWTLRLLQEAAAAQPKLLKKASPTPAQGLAESVARLQETVQHILNVAQLLTGDILRAEPI